MAVLVLVHLDGDAEQLVPRLREHVEPVMDRLGTANGARWHALSTTPEGVLVVDVWDDPEGLRRTMAMPEVEEAVRRARLPQPRIEVHELLDYRATV